jgi:hypothetical protein
MVIKGAQILTDAPQVVVAPLLARQRRELHSPQPVDPATCVALAALPCSLQPHSPHPLSIEHRQRDPRNLTQRPAVRFQSRHCAHALDSRDEELRQRTGLRPVREFAAALPPTQRLGEMDATSV